MCFRSSAPRATEQEGEEAARETNQRRWESERQGVPVRFDPQGFDDCAQRDHEPRSKGVDEASYLCDGPPLDMDGAAKADHSVASRSFDACEVDWHFIGGAQRHLRCLQLAMPSPLHRVRLER